MPTDTETVLPGYSQISLLVGSVLTMFNHVKVFESGSRMLPVYIEYAAIRRQFIASLDLKNERRPIHLHDDKISISNFGLQRPSRAPVF